MKVFLDACVLYPTVLREILTGCAAAGLYQAQWSPRVLEEWARAAARLGPEGERIARTEIAVLRDRHPRAEVRPHDGDLARLHLPDPNDVHVLAAAIAGGADALCTFNARDFPRHAMAAEGLERIDPDQLLARLDADGVARVALRVHATAEAMAGEPLPLRALMKRARVPKLGKRLAA